MTLLFALVLAAAAPPPAPPPAELRVCADPNNLPFSNAAGEGFENKLAVLIAKDMGATLHYVWWAQRRGNVRETLNAHVCDLIPGVGSNLDMLATTAPYYRSSYVAVTRADRRLDVDSFDDPRLKQLRIGVQLIGDDGSNTPPAHALERRGIVDNVRGYMIYGNYAQPDPQRAIVDAVAKGEVDIAFVWGPVAAYFAQREPVPLAIRPVTPAFDGPQLPMVFDVSVGVRRDDLPLKTKVEEILEHRQADVRTLLKDYRIPAAGDQEDGSEAP